MIVEFAQNPLSMVKDMCRKCHCIFEGQAASCCLGKWIHSPSHISHKLRQDNCPQSPAPMVVTAVICSLRLCPHCIMVQHSWAWSHCTSGTDTGCWSSWAAWDFGNWKIDIWLPFGHIIRIKNPFFNFLGYQINNIAISWMNLYLSKCFQSPLYPIRASSQLQNEFGRLVSKTDRLPE